MPSGDHRQARPVATARPPSVPAPIDNPIDDALDDAFGEWEEPAFAAGSVGNAAPVEPAPAPHVSRTATVHDPLTTGLLAEVTRQSQTVELSPEQIEAAFNAEPAEPAAPAPAEQRAPSSPHVIRRR